jgi:hypothetical protein
LPKKKKTIARKKLVSYRIFTPPKNKKRGKITATKFGKIDNREKENQTNTGRKNQEINKK